LLLASGFALSAIRGGILSPLWAGALVALVAVFVIGTVRSLRGQSSLLSREVAVVTDGTPSRAKRHLRGVARRVLESVVPSWSSNATVLVILAGFALAALLVPAALELPRYV
jgi:hypothetical protein